MDQKWTNTAYFTLGEFPGAVAWTKCGPRVDHCRSTPACLFSNAMNEDQKWTIRVDHQPPVAFADSTVSMLRQLLWLLGPLNMPSIQIVPCFRLLKNHSNKLR